MFTNSVELWNEEDSDEDCKYIFFLRNRSGSEKGREREEE